MSAKPTRDDYLNECRRTEKEFFQQRYLMKYVKKGNKDNLKKVGVVLAYKDPTTNKVKIGWSLCCKKDKFIREVAIVTALKPDHQLELGSDEPKMVPHTVGKYIQRMVERASTYFFKEENQNANT